VRRVGQREWIDLRCAHAEDERQPGCLDRLLVGMSLPFLSETAKRNILGENARSGFQL
jgi:hypothetical protein